MIKSRLLQKINCHSCAANYLCIANDLSSFELDELNNLISNVRYLLKKDLVCSLLSPLQNLYAVHKGSCKEYWLDVHGNENVTTFYFPGDLIGLESIAGRKHLFSVVALEDTEICVIPIDALLKLMSQQPNILKRFINITSFKMQNAHSTQAKVTADQQVCDFLLNIIMRMHEREPNAKEVCLSMSQLDISNFLGVAYETVNRVFKNLKLKKIIKMNNKTLEAFDLTELERLGRMYFSTQQDKVHKSLLNKILND
ncbi:fumarate/nitrate reduction transcriptional regulator Fnr [soil metagenome]